MQSGISASLGREDARYQATPANGGYYVNNPGQRLSAEFTPAGARIANDAASWQMNLRSYGYGTDLRDVGSASIEAKENRVEYHRGSITEWYINGPVGMEQGFTLNNRPASGPDVTTGSPLTLKIALAGNVTPKLNADNSLTLANNGTPTFRYSGLTASDATGNVLKAWMEVNGSNLLLHVDDRTARYPLTVDPYVQTVILTASDGVTGDQGGYSVAFNNDYAVVGAPSMNNVTGAVYVYKTPSAATTTYTAKLTASNGVAGDGFGTSVGIGPDDTIIVGAPFANTFTGAAYVFMVPATGGFKTTSAYTAALTAFDGSAGDVLGFSVAVASNVIIVGAPGYNNSIGSALAFPYPTVTTSFYTVREVDSAGVAGDSFGWKVAAYKYTNVIGTPYANNLTGAAYLYEPNPVSLATYTAKFTSNTSVAGDAFGNDVTTDGTLNDPSIVAVGAPFHTAEKGAVYIYKKPNGVNGWKTTKASNAILTSADSVAYDGFGFSVGLSNGVLGVGAPGYNNFTGKAYVYVQPTGGFATTTTPTDILHPSPAITGETFGWSVSVAPNGSVLSGAPADSSTGPGAAYVYK